MKKIALLLLGILSLQLAVMAVPPDVKFPAKKMPPVTFSHKFHLSQKGFTCKTCHPSIIPNMSEKNNITMGDINKGKFCGVCHREKGKSFAVKGNCAKCHVKAS